MNKDIYEVFKKIFPDNELDEVMLIGEDGELTEVDKMFKLAWLSATEDMLSSCYLGALSLFQQSHFINVSYEEFSILADKILKDSLVMFDSTPRS